MQERVLISLLIICQLFYRFESQKAIIFSSSVGYYNYRQTSNALKVYHKLKEYGFSDQQILLIIPQNTSCCEKNPLYGSASFNDGDYTNINSELQIDSDYTGITMQRIIDQMRTNFQAHQIIKTRLSPSLKPEPLFIYITGHGGNTYFKVREREAIIMENFKQLFLDLTLSQRFSKVLLLSDSCSAVTPFEDVKIENFTVFASSSWDEKSQSHGFDQLLNAPKSDDFTFYLMEYLEEHDPRQTSIKLKDILDYMSFAKLKVHSKLMGRGLKNTLQINEYIVKIKNQVAKKVYRLQNIL